MVGQRRGEGLWRQHERYKELSWAKERWHELEARGGRAPVKTPTHEKHFFLIRGIGRALARARAEGRASTIQPPNKRLIHENDRGMIALEVSRAYLRVTLYCTSCRHIGRYARPSNMAIERNYQPQSPVAHGSLGGVQNKQDRATETPLVYIYAFPKNASSEFSSFFSPHPAPTTSRTIPTQETSLHLLLRLFLRARHIRSHQRSRRRICASMIAR